MNDFIVTDSIYAVPTGLVHDRRDAMDGVRQLNHRISQSLATTKLDKGNTRVT